MLLLRGRGAAFSALQMQGFSHPQAVNQAINQSINPKPYTVVVLQTQLRGLSKLELNGQRGTVLPLEFPEQACLGFRVCLEKSNRDVDVS